MRLLNALKNDIRFQIKYGFYEASGMIVDI